MRSWRPKERLPTRRSFGSRTAVHSREGSSGIRGTLTPSNYYYYHYHYHYHYHYYYYYYYYYYYQ